MAESHSVSHKWLGFSFTEGTMPFPIPLPPLPLSLLIEETFPYLQDWIAFLLFCLVRPTGGRGGRSPRSAWKATSTNRETATAGAGRVADIGTREALELLAWGKESE